MHFWTSCQQKTSERKDQILCMAPWVWKTAFYQYIMYGITLFLLTKIISWIQVHYGLDGAQHQYSESGITYTRSSQNLNETYHIYTVEHFSGVIRWYIDDTEYSSITKEEMEPYMWSFDEEFYFILNLAVGGNWPGNPLDIDGPGGDATA